MDNQENGCLMGCSCSPDGAGGVEHDLEIDGWMTGIVRGHAYSISKVFEIPDPDMENPRKTHRLLLIRNPWGSKEWLGDWSGAEDDEKLNKHMDKIKDFIEELEEDERFDPFADDGLFFMNFKSFRMCFDKMFVALNFPDEWNAVRYQCSWKPNVGGLPIKGTAA